jgi:hypothetical protein
MVKSKFKFYNIFVLIFISIWSSFVFTAISFFAFISLEIITTSILMAIVGGIIFIPFVLLILFLLYFAAKSINREINYCENKVLKIISRNIIPPVVYLLIGSFASIIDENNRLNYLLSMPLSFLIIYLFNRISKILDEKKEKLERVKK